MEVHQVLVVCEDLDREEGVVEIMSPGLQGMDDGKEFLVVDIVNLFCWGEQLREVRTGVSVTV